MNKAPRVAPPTDAPIADAELAAEVAFAKEFDAMESEQVNDFRGMVLSWVL